MSLTTTWVLKARKLDMNYVIKSVMFYFLSFIVAGQQS